MKIRLLVQVTGSFHSRDGGVEPGEVVDVDDLSAKRYINSGIAESVSGSVEEHAVAEPENVETATVKPKRGGRRPVKPREWHDEKAPGWSEVDPA